jgi:hypothetical protein
MLLSCAVFDTSSCINTFFLSSINVGYILYYTVQYCIIALMTKILLETVLRNLDISTLLDGTNLRLNWNIESDLNVYWIKFKNFLSLYWFKNKQY